MWSHQPDTGQASRAQCEPPKLGELEPAPAGGRVRAWAAHSSPFHGEAGAGLSGRLAGAVRRAVWTAAGVLLHGFKGAGTVSVVPGE